MLLLIDISPYFSCYFELIKEIIQRITNIHFFKTEEKHELISINRASLALANDALLNDISLLILKVLEFSLGTNLIPKPFGLLNFYFHFFSNYLKKLINYLGLFIFIILINTETR